MKNSNNGNSQDNIRYRLNKLLSLPLEGVLFFQQTLREKLEFSIRFKLSVNYLKIFVKSMILAGLGILLIFGTSTILYDVYDDHSALEEFLATKLKTPDINDQEVQLLIKRFAREEELPLMIYDQSHTLILATDLAPTHDSYTSLLGVVPMGEKIYLALNKDGVSKIRSFPLFEALPFIGVQDGESSLFPSHVISYTDLSPALEIIIHLAQTILVVYAVVFFFGLISIGMIGRGFFLPIKEMTQTVRDISTRNLNLRLNVSGSKDELKELALTFNEMMNRIENNYNRQKQFVSDASHELRTPIAVIQGYADMLDRWGKDDREVLQESIDAIKNESENMKELIDKLLFLARHDKENFVLQKEDFSLTEVLQEIARETKIIDSNHKISFDIDSEVIIYADKNRIKQALRIFIDNALKYTPSKGDINVTLGYAEDYHTISVKDTGIGMTREELEHIFNRFYRTEESRNKEKGGHGLGLAIAKIIILGHGGKIKVKSKLGVGTEFMIMLKQEPQP